MPNVPTLNTVAFANSLAVPPAALYILFVIIALVSPSAFQFLFNAQFFGADVASLFSAVWPSVASLATLRIVVVMAWVMGWRWLSNRLVRVS